MTTKGKSIIEKYHTYLNTLPKRKGLIPMPAMAHTTSSQG
jgi:hypothetical protein